MVWYLYIVALLFIGAGVYLILNTEQARNFSREFAETGNYRLWGILGAAFGVLLAISAFWSGVVWFLFILGLGFSGLGAFLFFGQEERVDALLRVWAAVSDRGLRLWGLILVVVGTAIMSWT